MAESEQTDKLAQQPVPGFATGAVLYCKGVAMGLGDSVPGISGGTIAVITEIYDQLIYSIRSLDMQALRLVAGGRFAECWRHINGTFLLLVALGMLSGLLLSANTVLYLLDNNREALMAFFIGLVLASVALLRKEYTLRSATGVLILLVGALLTAGVGLMDGLQVAVSIPYLFVCGAIAICAMILPGLSGAFILILLGAYQYMLEALLAFELPSILVFFAGCLCGLLVFSRLLALVLRRFHELAYAFISGMLLGSLFILWPWQQTVSSYLDADGEAHALRTLPVWPLNYAEASGQQPEILLAVLMALLGMAVVWGLHAASSRSHRG